MTYSERLNNLIPGGCHTYSRGDDQYPENAPQIFERGEGAYTYTPDCLLITSTHSSTAY